MAESVRLVVQPGTAHLAPGGRLVFLRVFSNASGVAEWTRAHHR